MNKTNRIVATALSAVLAVACVGAAGWWGVYGSAIAAPLPPAPPDEGEESPLRAQYLQALISRRPDHWQARVSLAAQFAGENRHGEAVRLLDEATRFRPKDSGILRALAYSAEAAGRTEDQLRAWTRLAQQFPYDAEARMRLSDLYRQVGMLDLASRTADDALRLSPQDPDALRNRAVLDFATGNYRAATARATTLLAVSPGHPVGHSIRGASLRELGRWKEAVKDAEAALQAAPNDFQFRADLARIYLEQPTPRPDLALQLLGQGPPSSVAASQQWHYWRGIAFHRQGRSEEALAELGPIGGRSPEFEQTALTLSRLFIQRGEGEPGRKWAQVHRELQARRDALRAATQALHKEPQSAQRHLQVARAALGVGERTRAAFEAHTALRLQPGNREAAALIQQLESSAGGVS